MRKFIVIEGLDGSGKQTQADLLCEYYKKCGQAVKRISFPNYGSPSGELVSFYLSGGLGGSPGDVGAYAASSFYAVDRYISYKTDWADDYKNGIVIADRYTTSNAYHQLSKLPESEWDDFLEWLFDYEFCKLTLPKPDVVIYLDLPPKHGSRLMTRRYNGDDGKKDIHERDMSYLIKCRECALFVADRMGWNVIKCDSDGDILPRDAMHSKILSCLL